MTLGIDIGVIKMILTDAAAVHGLEISPESVDLARTHLTMPTTRIVRFAIATALRLDNICRADWSDLDRDRRMLVIRDRKDPRKKAGNEQRIPLFAATGFDAGP